MAETLRQAIKENNYREVLSVEFLSALIIAMVFGILLLLTPRDLTSGLHDILQAFIVITGGLLGFIIAAFSLTLSIGDSKFRSAFLKSEMYRSMKVSFSLTAILIGVCSVVAIATIIFMPCIEYRALIFIFTVSMFLFLWIIFNVIMLISNAIRLLGDLI